MAQQPPATPQVITAAESLTLLVARVSKSLLFPLRHRHGVVSPGPSALSRARFYVDSRITTKMRSTAGALKVTDQGAQAD